MGKFMMLKVFIKNYCVANCTKYFRLSSRNVNFNYALSYNFILKNYKRTIDVFFIPGKHNWDSTISVLHPITNDFKLKIWLNYVIKKHYYSKNNQ